MSLITRLATASLDVSTARNAPQITGLYAGEALDLCAPCYIKSSDGKVYMCNATADNEAAEFAGFSPRAVSADEPVTLFGLGTRMRYGSSLTPGDIYYVGATAGRLDTAQQAGDSVGVAMAVSDTDIVIIRSHPNYPSGAIDTGDIADDAITLAKMADLAQGSIIVGGVADAPTALDASTSGQILVGDGTDLKSVAMSGDATLAANGALTIAADAVDDTMIDWGTGANQVAISKAQARVFFSTEIAGDGNPQNTAHGLGAIPAGVLVIPSSMPDSAWSLVQGEHDATNVVVTCTNTGKYYVFAWA
jgi:hypothetical protein